MLPPHSSDDCLDLITAMEEIYGAAFEGFDEDIMFYEGQLDSFLEVPEGFEVTIPTTPRAVVDEAVDNATPSDINVYYHPRKLTEKAEKDADNIRRFTRGVWRYWRQKGSDIDIIRDFLKNLFMSGKAAFKVAPDWTLWPQLDEEDEKKLRRQGRAALKQRIDDIERIRKENFPLFCRSLAPSCIMEDPTIGPRKLWAIERYQSSPAEVRNYYAKDVEEWRDSYYNLSLPVHEVWTASYVNHLGEFVQGKRYIFVNYELVDEGDNPYGDLPYIIKYSGFGREAYEGAPEFKAVGFFTRANKSMFLAEMRRLTQIDAIMQEVAFPVAFLPDSVDGENIDFSPGFVNYVPDDVMQYMDKVWLTPQIPSADYLNSLQIIGNQIERGTVQRTLRGAGVPGTDSAAQYNMLGNQAKLRIESAKLAAQEAMAEASEKVLRYIDVTLGDDVSVFIAEKDGGPYTVGPKSIKGHYRLAIEFQPNEDAVKERKLVLANDAIAKGGLSRYDAYTFAGFENPWELIERKNADDLMQEPLIKRALAKRTLKAWGEDVDALELEEKQEQAEQQMKLSQIAQQLQIGTPQGGDPMSPDGNPANAQPTPPALGPAQGPQQGGPPQAPGMFAIPGGAPAAAQAGPVTGLMRDINQLSAA